MKREEEKLFAAKKGKKIDIEKEKKEAKQIFDHEHHIKEGSRIREFILGFNDGLVSIFALVTGVVGAHVSSKIVVLTGFAGLTAGAISMGLNNYISTKSQIEFFNSEIEREKKEIEVVPERERDEVREIYRLKGFKGKLLDQIVKKICSDKKIWLKVMLDEELGLTEQQFASPVKIALITGISFIFGAMIPILPYFFTTTMNGVVYSSIISLAGLFAIGSGRTFITRRNWLRSGIEMVLIGILAAVAAYLVGGLFAV